MEKRKLTKEDIYNVRDIEGFPIESSENIIALSDAPRFTACPNPFIAEFIDKYGIAYDVEEDDYHCEPFAADVSEGKKDPIYNAHSYHTKVPYKAIMRYLLHYTKPGDIVFDGFCGTGMTGLAAQMCGSEDIKFKSIIMDSNDEKVWGKRHAIISDLSPAATFISSVYNTPVDIEALDNAFQNIISKAEGECSWMYETSLPEIHPVLGTDRKVKIEYTVWSDVFVCPSCCEELVFWDVAIDKETGAVLDEFQCKACSSILKKKSCERVKTSIFDDGLQNVVSIAKQVPVLIGYKYGGREYTKSPTEEDYKLIEKIEEIKIPYWYPTDRMPYGGESRRNDKYGITHIHQFFTKRNLYVISCLWDAIESLEANIEIKNALKSVITGVMHGTSKLQWFRLNSTFPNMILSGTLYIGSMVREWNVLDWVCGKYKSIKKLKVSILNFDAEGVLVSTNSLTQTTIPESSIDYIFTDPPFGANLNYSELSFMWEAWLKVKTNNDTEVIMNPHQNKGLLEYQELMTRCFKEYYRVLKPSRWITIEFHNSKNAVWNAIQEAIQKAGFVVADVRTLDKKQSSFKQLSSAGAVKQDLVISAYKPNDNFVSEIMNHTGSEETAWDFVRQHLEKLPVVVDADNNGRIDILFERQAFLLFDRMIAYHIVHAIPIPLDAVDFYKGLDEHFIKRDEMYFLPDQVSEYDNARIKMDVEDVQMELFVTNEKSAIAWLYKQLEEPQTYADLQPKFMQEAKTIDKHEIIPELAVLLEENFIQNDEGKWYIPDVTKEADVNKLREKRLWKEFEGYLNSKGKLKLFRSEAIRVGFSKLWKEQNYKAIVEVAERLPEKIVQEDPNILMYYDISLSRI